MRVCGGGGCGCVCACVRMCVGGGGGTWMCVCKHVHVFVCMCARVVHYVNIPSKRQIKLLVEHLSVHPLTHRILSLSGTKFPVQVIHFVDGKIGAQVMPVWVTRARVVSGGSSGGLRVLKHPPELPNPKVNYLLLLLINCQLTL